MDHVTDRCDVMFAFYYAHRVSVSQHSVNIPLVMKCAVPIAHHAAKSWCWPIDCPARTNQAGRAVLFAMTCAQERFHSLPDADTHSFLCFITQKKLTTKE